MQLVFSKKTWMIVGLVVAGLVLSSYWDEWFGPKEISGVVIDTSTNAPMAGAYVLAEYTEAGGTWFGHMGSWCVRTRGMYTAADGKFKFPMPKARQPLLHFGKKDYFYTTPWAAGLTPTTEQAAGKYYLMPKQPGTTEKMETVSCSRAVRRQDLFALIEYLKLQLDEERSDPRRVQFAQDTEDKIRRYEAYPE